MNKNASETVLFVGDTHFHLVPEPGEDRRIMRFLEFLETARAADRLVLLGDVFDFWFDYPHFRLRGYEEILSGLDAVRDAGVRIDFVGGNHDIWAASYFHERYGSHPDGEPLDLLLDGVRVHVVHGDGLLARDWVYGSFRRTVRHKAGRIFAKSFHPELLYHFSRWLSGTSRRASRDESEVILQRAQRHLEATTGAWDLLLIGHVHLPFHLRHEGRAMAALGSWFGEESYGLWRDGAFSVRDFATDGPFTTSD